MSRAIPLPFVHARRRRTAVSKREAAIASAEARARSIADDRYPAFDAAMRATTSDLAKWSVVGSSTSGAYARLARTEILERGKLVADAIRKAFEAGESTYDAELGPFLMAAFTAILEDQCEGVRERLVRAVRSASTDPDRAERDAFNTYRGAIIAATSSGYVDLGHVVKTLRAIHRSSVRTNVERVLMVLVGILIARIGDIVAFVIALVRGHS